jgi:hypothetical protein
VIGGAFASTDPAELILAEETCHVVTAAYFWNFYGAHRTKSNALVKFTHHEWLTRCEVTMPFVSATKTHILSALRTGKLPLVYLCCPHKTITSLSRTESNQCIIFMLLFLFEPFKPFNHFRLVAKQGLYLLFGGFLFASSQTT